MKTAFLILLPLGLGFVAYACTLAEAQRPVPAFVTPEWTVDAHGRSHPTGFETTLPAPANFNPPPTDH